MCIKLVVLELYINCVLPTLVFVKPSVYCLDSLITLLLGLFCIMAILDR